MQPRRPQVPDLPGRPAADPGLAVEDQPAPDAGPPPDAQDRVELFARPKLELGLDRHLDVVADPDGNPDLLGEVLAQGKGAGPARQIAGVGDDASLFVCVPRRADAHAGEVAGAEVGLGGRLTHRRGHLPRHVLRPAGGRGRAPRLAEHPVVGVHYDSLDLGPAEVDASARCLIGVGSHYGDHNPLL
jgi:hypothetical protein